MWTSLECLLWGHDYHVRGNLWSAFLKCDRCGRRSKGWNLSHEIVSRRHSQRGLEAPPAEPRTDGTHPSGFGSASTSQSSLDKRPPRSDFTRP